MADIGFASGMVKEALDAFEKDLCLVVFSLSKNTASQEEKILKQLQDPSAIVERIANGLDFFPER